MANKPSLMEPDYEEDSTGSTDVSAVFEEFRKRFLDSTDPKEAMDAFCGMCELAEHAEGGEGYGGEKPKLKIEVC